MELNNDVRVLIKDLANNGTVSELLKLHVISCVRRIGYVSGKLHNLCVVLAIVTIFSTFFIALNLIWLTVLYWIFMLLAIHFGGMFCVWCVHKGIFCRKPKVDFIITSDITDKLQLSIKDYLEMPLPPLMLIKILIQTVPIFKKEPFYIAVRYLGTKAIYKFDGNILQDEIYDKVVNKIDISDVIELAKTEEAEYAEEYKDDNDDYYE